VVRPASHGVSRAPCYSGTPLNAYFIFRVRDFHALWSDFPDGSARLFQLKAPATPGRIPVWAFPLSIASTYGINFFLCSSRFLDVSVPWVRSSTAIHSPCGDWVLNPAAFPHSEIPGSSPVCRLPETYRRLPRLSSPLDAKTSTIHP
jgi:hypothetical protein